MEKFKGRRYCRNLIRVGVLLLSVCVSQAGILWATPVNLNSVMAEGVLFVKTQPLGSGDGSSWDNAFDGKFLAQYLRNSAVDGLKVYIAEGTYIPYLNGTDDPGNARAYYFEVNKQNMELYGGYSDASVGTDLTIRNPKTYITRLSGEIQNDAAPQNNSYHVILIANGANASISGFSISDGYAEEDTDDKQNGGGILDLGGGNLVRISQTIVENNWADFGSGVYFYGNARTIMDSVVIRNNTSIIGYGGAIFAWGDFALLNSTVRDNVNDGIVSWGGDIGIRNSTITNNTRCGITAQNTTLKDIRIALVSTTITDNGTCGVKLDVKGEGLTHLTFNNNLIVNNGSNLDFSAGLPVDTLLFQYSIVGNTKYITNAQDVYTLSLPVELGELADNGGWSGTQALLDICRNPAVGAGDTALLRKPDAKYDQRGVLRSNPPAIGAYDGVHGFQMVSIVSPNDTVCENINTVIAATVSIPSDRLSGGYQWYKDDGVILGETGNTLDFASIQPADSGKYNLLVMTDDPNCSQMSDSIIIRVKPLPVISRQPQGSGYGESEQLSVEAEGTSLTYQWYKDKVALTGETNPSYHITGVGKYVVAITNLCGTVSSDTAEISKALLTVTANDNSVSYGFNPATYSGSYAITGFVNNENATVLTTNPKVFIAGNITSTTLPGIYPGAILVGGAVAGNYDFDYHYGTLTILDTGSDIASVAVDGKAATSENDTAFYIMADCNTNPVEIYISASPHASVSINNSNENPYTYTLDNYGKNIVIAEVTAADGHTQAYTISIDEPIPADQIFIMRWSDVITVPSEFEGIACQKVEWYREGIAEPLSRSTAKGYIQVEEPGMYYAIINDTLTTCSQEFTTVHRQSKAYPNPVSGGQTITLETGLDDGQWQGSIVNIVDMQGKIWGTQTATGTQIQLIAPSVPGTYMIHINVANGIRVVKVMIVN